MSNYKQNKFYYRVINTYRKGILKRALQRCRDMNWNDADVETIISVDDAEWTDDLSEMCDLYTAEITKQLKE